MIDVSRGSNPETGGSSVNECYGDITPTISAILLGAYAGGQTARGQCDTIVMLDKPTSEQIRRESEKLRETAVDLMEHAALLIDQSANLEKRILARDKSKTSKR